MTGKRLSFLQGSSIYRFDSGKELIVWVPMS